MEKFNIESLYDKEIKVTQIRCNKGYFYVYGIIEDKYYIEASNNGEYRTSLNYDVDEKFTLKSFDYVWLEVNIEDDDGNMKRIY